MSQEEPSVGTFGKLQISQVSSFHVYIHSTNMYVVFSMYQALFEAS